MRMRKKNNLIPRMARCAHLRINGPARYQGRWLELGCGKARFAAELAPRNPEALIVAAEKNAGRIGDCDGACV